MAPPSVPYTNRLIAQGADARAPLKGWKELIDNGLNPSGHGPSQGPNRTTVTEEPFPARVLSGVNNLIPLYCGLLGALICGLVLWIVLKQARRRGRDSKLLPPMSASLAPGDSLAVSAPLARAGRQDLAVDTCEFYDCENYDEGTAVSRRRLVDLSESRLQCLEQMLDRDLGWKALASEMGYQADAILEFESRAHLSSTSPAGLLLRHWGASSAGAARNIGDLHTLLLAVGLIDALLCLRESAASPERIRMYRPVPSAAPPDTEGVKKNLPELGGLEGPQV